jgi:hypothetical protein
MKVLRLKDKADFYAVKVARGLNHIIPVYDGNGDFILPLEILKDPAYEDLVEDILDKMELVDFVPQPDFSPLQQDTPVKEVKGEFKAILESAKDLEDAVQKYYESKSRPVTKT